MEEEKTKPTSDQEETTSSSSARKSSSSRKTSDRSKSSDATKSEEQASTTMDNGDKMVSAASQMMRGMTNGVRGGITSIWNDARTIRDRWQHS